MILVKPKCPVNTSRRITLLAIMIRAPSTQSTIIITVLTSIIIQIPIVYACPAVIYGRTKTGSTLWHTSFTNRIFYISPVVFVLRNISSFIMTNLHTGVVSIKNISIVIGEALIAKIVASCALVSANSVAGGTCFIAFLASGSIEVVAVYTSSTITNSIVIARSTKCMT